MTESVGRANNHIEHTPLDIFTSSYEIGDLYDAREGRFLHAGKLFKAEESFVQQRTSYYEYVLESTKSNRMEHLDVSANVKAEFLGGLVKVEGSAAYAKSSKRDATRHSMHVILRGKTGTKKVANNVYELPASELLLEHLAATHVITEIAMGYNVATTLSVSKYDASSSESASGNLQVVVKALCAAGGGSVDFGSVSEEFQNKVSIKITGDFELESAPQNLKQMSEFNSKVTKFAQNSNGGWGVPKKVFLTPLTAFKSIANPLNVSIADIKASTLASLSSIMDALDALVLKSEELIVVNEREGGLYWSAGVNKNLKAFQLRVEREVIAIQSDLRPALKQLYTENDEAGVQNIIQDCQLSSGSCDKLRTKGATWLSSVQEHIGNLQAHSTLIRSRHEGNARLKWISPLSTSAVNTAVLECPPSTVVLKIKEGFPGASPYSPDDQTDQDHSAVETVGSAALADLIKYLEDHAMIEGADAVTIVAYDGHAARDDKDGSDSTVLKADRFFKLVELGSPEPPLKVDTWSAAGEALALMHVFITMGGSGWTRKRDWESGQDISKMDGVTTANGRVTMLDLRQNNVVSGYLPPDISSLQALLKLDLSLNRQLTGSIPPHLTKLEALQELWLGGNNFMGVIPDELPKMKSLLQMDLSNNKLTGPIPTAIGYMENLKKLWLHGNQLTGEIPATLGELQGMVTLTLHNNKLRGSIPRQLGTMSSLEYLSLKDNRLSGSIPGNLGNLKKLKTLTLNGNNLSGDVPTELIGANKADKMLMRLQESFVKCQEEYTAAKDWSTEHSGPRNETLAAAEANKNWTKEVIDEISCHGVDPNHIRSLLEKRQQLARGCCIRLQDRIREVCGHSPFLLYVGILADRVSARNGYDHAAERFTKLVKHLNELWS